MRKITRPLWILPLAYGLLSLLIGQMAGAQNLSALRDQCLSSERLKIVNESTAWPAQVVTDLSARGVVLNDLTLDRRIYSRVLSKSWSGTPTGLMQSSQLTESNFVIQTTQNFQLDFDGGNLIYDSSTMGLFKDGNLAAWYLWSWHYDNNCSKTLSDLTVYKVAQDPVDSNNAIILFQSASASGRSINVPLQTITLQNSEMTPTPLNFSVAVSNEKKYLGRSVPLINFGSDGATLTQYSVSASAQIPGLPPTVSQGINYSTNGLSYSFFSDKGRYLFKGTVQGNDILFGDTVSAQGWMEQSLNGSNPAPAPQMTGFNPGAFNASEIKYEIQGSGKSPSLFNTNEYFNKTTKIGTGGSWKIDIVAKADGPTLDNAVGAPSSNFLKTTFLIHPDVASGLVSQVTQMLGTTSGGLKSLDPLKLGQSIATVVSTAIKFGNLEDGKSAHTTEEIISAGHGVCQEFSALFVAVARAVGLPSRVIMGYYLTDSMAVSHNWVEIQNANGSWIPLEPQAKNGQMIFTYYLPLGVDGRFEAMDQVGFNQANAFDGGVQESWSAYKIIPSK